jgi:predicted peptidase
MPLIGLDSLGDLTFRAGFAMKGLMIQMFKKSLLVSALVAGLSSVAFAAEPGQQTSGSFVAAIDKPIGYDYLIYLPENYTGRDKKFPLMLFLHGAGERGDNLELVKRHGPPKLAAAGKSFPFIVVSPQCPANEIWDAEVLLRLVRSIENQYRVDSGRIYVTGLSMGGFGTWSLIARAPEKFAAAAPVCGGGNFIDFVLGSKETKDALKSLPIWVFHGGADGVVKVSEAYRMVSLLERGAREIKLKVYPGVGHDSWTETYNNPALYEWFLSWNRH